MLVKDYAQGIYRFEYLNCAEPTWLCIKESNALYIWQLCISQTINPPKNWFKIKDAFIYTKHLYKDAQLSSLHSFLHISVWNNNNITVFTVGK